MAESAEGRGSGAVTARMKRVFEISIEHSKLPRLFGMKRWRCGYEWVYVPNGAGIYNLKGGIWLWIYDLSITIGRVKWVPAHA